MDKARARELLANERARLERLLRTEMAATAPDTGDDVDDANWRIAEETGRAVSRSLRDRWSALERAEDRLQRGTYGRSIVSGKEIPEERLEADPLAELLVEEAAVEAFRARRTAENISGLSSTRRTLAALADREERDTSRTTTRSPRKAAASEPEEDAEATAEEDLDVDELEDGEPLDEEDDETPEEFDGDEELASELDDEDEDEDAQEDDKVAEATEPEDSGKAEARPPRRRRSGRG